MRYRPEILNSSCCPPYRIGLCQPWMLQISIVHKYLPLSIIQLTKSFHFLEKHSGPTLAKDLSSFKLHDLKSINLVTECKVLRCVSSLVEKDFLTLLTQINTIF